MADNILPPTQVTWRQLFQRTFTSWNEDNALRLGAALAYYSVFSIGPLLVITLGIAGLVLDQKTVSGQLQQEVAQYVGTRAAGVIQSMMESASKPGHGSMATIIGFVVLMVGAAGVFGELKAALNTIWGVKPKPGFGLMAFIWEKVLNFGMVLAIGFLLLCSLILSTVISFLNTQVSAVLTLPPAVWTCMTMLVSFCMVTTLFALIFKILPDVHIRWRDVWVGAAITALLFELGKTGLGWYLGRESTVGAYGAAGSVVLLLLWVYYDSCIMFFGAEFTRVHSESRGMVPRAMPQAQKVTNAERVEQGMKPTSRPVADAKRSAKTAQIALPAPHSRMNDWLKRHMGAAMVTAVSAGAGLSLWLQSLGRGRRL